jgi:hypothetical protein
MKNSILRVMVLLSFLVLMGAGCATDLSDRRHFDAYTLKAGETDHNKVYATAAKVTNPFGQEAIGIQFHAEAKHKEEAYRRFRTEYPAQQPSAPPAAQFPPGSPRASKALIGPPPPAPPVQPPTQVVDEVGYYPRTIPMGTVGGRGDGTLKHWVGKILGNSGPFNALIPGTKVDVSGVSDSSSSSAASSSAAAAAAAGSGK